MGVYSPYSSTIKKLKSREDFDKPFQPPESIFSGENPYSGGTQESKDTTTDQMAERVTTPTVDFTKDTLTGQAPAKTEAGQILSSGADALMVFGDPSMKALGLGLKTVQGITDAKRQRQMDKYNAEVRKIQARQEALNRLSQLGQGMRA